MSKPIFPEARPGPHPDVPQLGTWLTDLFLPSWIARTVLPGRPGYVESVDAYGASVEAGARTTLVTSRLVYTYSLGHALSPGGDSLAAARHGLDFLLSACRDGQGRFVHLVGADGQAIAPHSDLYDLAFVLLALGAFAAASGNGEALAVAEEVGRFVDTHLADPRGGYREDTKGTSERRQFPHMHLFEACQILSQLAPAGEWGRRAEHVLDLLEQHFLIGESVGEWYEGDWRPAVGARGQERQIGHQFEWAWLLYRHSALTGSERAMSLADRLYRFGLAHAAVANGEVAPMIDAVDAEGRSRNGLRPLWPMTELLRASVAKAEFGGDPEARPTADAAARAIFAHYLDPRTGLWVNELGPDNSAIPAPVPTRVLYHLVPAFAAYARLSEGAFASLPLLLR